MFQERGSSQQCRMPFRKSSGTETERCTLDLAAEKSWDVLKLFWCCGGVKPAWQSLKNVV